MSAHFFIIGLCLLWVLMCGRMWWVIGREHVWQRRLIAIGAGLGAAMFYLLGTTLWTVVKPPGPPPVASGEEIRVSPKAGPDQ